MKTIVISYDGSECSEAIPTDLHHAGLPPGLKAYVVSAGELWTLPPPDPAGLVPEALALPSTDAGRAAVLHVAECLAARGAERLRTLFPEWRVEPVGLVGPAARTIVDHAQAVCADLIFIGSHSRSTVGRFFLGSVSQKVAAEAKCSVHICRPRPRTGAAPRLLVAVDGSTQSHAAVQAVAQRDWPTGTMVAVLTVIEPAAALTGGVHLYAGKIAAEAAAAYSGQGAGVNVPPEFLAEWVLQRDANLERLEAEVSAACRQLELAGLNIERHSLVGEPKHTLFEWAERWMADCIFAGASGLQHPATETLGTVASALAVRAHCSVEIVRPPVSSPQD